MDQSKVLVLPQTNYLLSLMTIIRNEKTECPAFVNAFERVCGQLVPAGNVPLLLSPKPFRPSARC